jgi:membrane protein DedA with SNARE-associated domain
MGDIAIAGLWEEWGALAYAAVVLWAFFEGETFVIAAAALGAVSGVIDPFLLMICAWTGSFFGDQTWFLLGRRFGPTVERRFPAAQPRFDQASALLERYGAVFVLSFRFLYGIRNVAAAVCGMAKMPWRRFLPLNFCGAGVWAASFVAAGWYLGSWLGPEKLAYGLAGIVVLVAAVLVLRLVRKRRGAAAQPAEG